MNSFSIAELQQYSGVKAHTIRIWEQRYQALQPERTEGNARYYDASQLRRLLNIVSLSKEYRISDLCVLGDKDLNAMIEERIAAATTQDPEHGPFINQIIAAALTYDEPSFDATFTKCIKLYSLRDLYVFVLYPALVRLGLMWSNETLRPAHEHFITNLMRQKILSAIDKLPVPKSKRQTWLLFLPEDELHETGLLLSQFLIRQAGRKVIYLGANLPMDTLELAVDHVQPTHMLTFLVRNHEDEMDADYIKSLSKRFRHQEIYIACDPVRLSEFRAPANTTMLHAVEELEALLK